MWTDKAVYQCPEAWGKSRPPTYTEPVLNWEEMKPDYETITLEKE